MFNDFTMVAPHSRRLVEEDTIFRLNREAMLAAKKIGSELVVNSTVGALLDETGKLAVLPTVIDILRNLDEEDYCAYAPIAGLPDFLETAKKAAFGSFTPEGYMGVVATPGGTGAIRHTIWNYSEPLDTVLTADCYWGPYKNISEEHDRNLKTFSLFDNDYKFNISSFSKKTNEILEKQKRIVILLNSPANNPTGYNLSLEEWDEVIETLKYNAKDIEKRIILFVDIAYIDYSGDIDERRKFLTKFKNLPQNILVIFGFSMSKSYTLYGMRSGAMIGLSSNEEIAKEFRAINEFSNRGVWSNGTRPAMVVLNKIFNDKLLYEKVENEREVFRKLLDKRAEAFTVKSRDIGLEICPYKTGFFISIPCSNSKEIVEKLKLNNIYAVPMSKGIRFAICSVPLNKCASTPAFIKEAISR